MMGHDDPTLEARPAQGQTTVPPDSLAGPAMVGAFRVLSLLGEGGFGSVYLAEQTAPVHRRVALKVIKPGMDSRTVVARFEAERQALALMDHPGVAKVFDAGVTPEGRPYFAMELVRGRALTAYCGAERLGVDDRVRLMIQVCEAVQHAHMKGLIHRDLKPGNILVETTDGRPAAKVIDFGVAKALHGRLTDSTLYTEQGQMIGTPEYMAPEQARGSPDIDTRADVYALGAILYELLTGEPPFEATTLRASGPASIQRTIEEERPAVPSARVRLSSRPGRASSISFIDQAVLRRLLRRDLDWIVMKCLEKERARRYGSAGALAEDLRRYLNNLPVEAGPPSAPYRALKFAQRHRVAVGAGALILLTLVVGVVVTTGAMLEARSQRALAQEQAAAADRAREESEAVTSFLTRMIESVEPDELGRDVTVREVLDRGAGQIAGAFAERPAVEARLRQALGNSYQALGRLDEAEGHLEAALELRRRGLGEEHRETLRAAANLGALRMAQGRDTEAGLLLRRAAEGFERHLGPDHALTLGVISNLAVLHTRAGDTGAALDLHRRVLEGQRRAQGPDHPHTLGAMINLADLLAETGRLEEAEPIMRETVATWERAHGPDKPGTLLALHNLAMLELKRGRPQEAETIMRRVVEARLRILGPEHAETCGALANLGLILLAGGRVPEAQEVYTRAWEGCVQSLGPAHPTTVKVALQLMGTIESQGWPENRRATVEQIFRAARAGLERRRDTDPASLNDLAWFMLRAQPQSLRDPAGALALATEAVERDRARGGSELYGFLDTLAIAQNATGSPASALASQREALRLLPKDKERFRAEMEARLREYEAAAGGG